MCQVILKQYRNSADITVQIAGNYVSASPGKYAQISSHNWGLLKIKAVRVPLVICCCFLGKRGKCLLRLGYSDFSLPGVFNCICL